MTTVVVAGSKGAQYKTTDNGDGTYHCECLAWRFMKCPTSEKRCKHINEVFPRPGQSTPPRKPQKRKQPEKSGDGDDTSKRVKRRQVSVALAEKYNGKDDPTGRLMSEKLDGMRFIWCSDEQKLYSRNGNEIAAPKAVLEALPRDTDLDGELWMGRGKFQKTMSAVRGADWSGIKLMVFDAPNVSGPASERLSHAAIALMHSDPNGRWTEVVEHTPCTGGKKEVDKELKRIVDAGGEGLMLKHPTMPYTAGRTALHLKYKLFEDAEATVVGHENGTGKNDGLMGSLVCKDETRGFTFKIGTGFSEDQRRAPPPVGSVVTYKFQGRTDIGLPRFAVFLRERPDE